LLRDANSELSKLNCSYEQIVVDLKRAKSQAENLASELMKANEKLRTLALQDGLTGLYNHRHFHEILAQELERSKRHSRYLSLILFDIDFFKKVNDTFGHLIGDHVLKRIAAQIKKVTRTSDSLARFGGEEFAIVLPETNAAGLRVFGERIRRGIAGMEIGAQDQFFKVTVSVGGTTYEPDMNIDHQDIMIDVADKAVYQSKSLGRNRFSFIPLQDFIGRSINL
jgi:diguanylate cyclase (GGDEF)-like protein